MIKKIKCNILAVSKDSRYKEPERAVLPIDLSASLDRKIFRFFDLPGIATKTRITVAEIRERSLAGIPAGRWGEHLFRDLDTDKINFTTVDNTMYIERLLLNAQKKFDMIILLGKNLKVCDRLLHHEYGVYSAVNNKLPILVLHLMKESL